MVTCRWELIRLGGWIGFRIGVNEKRWRGLLQGVAEGQKSGWG